MVLKSIGKQGVSDFVSLAAVELFPAAPRSLCLRKLRSLLQQYLVFPGGLEQGTLPRSSRSHPGRGPGRVPSTDLGRTQHPQTLTLTKPQYLFLKNFGFEQSSNRIHATNQVFCFFRNLIIACNIIFKKKLKFIFQLFFEILVIIKVRAGN